MFGRLRNTLYSALGSGEEEGGGQSGVSPVHSQSRPKYPYQRPAFLNLSTADEIQVTADHSVRPIIVPRDVNSLPWSAGYAETINAGKSRFNEDQACVKEGRVSFVSGGKMTHIPYTLFSVYDGHAGAGCAVSASNDLWQVIQARLESVGPQLLAGSPPDGSSGSGLDHDTIWPGSTSRNISTESLIIGALETAFWETDQFIGEEKKVYHMPGGCTVLVALFILGKLYVANAGDSRAVLCRHSKAYPMSFDFTPVTERQRLQTIGRLQPHLLGDEYTCLEYCRKPSRRDIGSRILYRDAFMTGWAYKVVQETDMKFPMVFGEGKRSRLLATIGVTRGFGDHDLRAQASGTVYIKPFLTPQPEVRVLDVENELVTADDILVLGTDGLWDVVSNEEVASIVQRGLSAWDNESKAGRYRYISLAQDLVMSARGKLKERNWKRSNGSPATIDDITVFVIPILPYKHEYLGMQNGENEDLPRCENGTDAMDIEGRDSSPEKLSGAVSTQDGDDNNSSPGKLSNHGIVTAADQKLETSENHFGESSAKGLSAAAVIESTELGGVPGIPCIADMQIRSEAKASTDDQQVVEDLHNNEVSERDSSSAAVTKHCDKITTHSKSDLNADGEASENDGAESHRVLGPTGDDDGLGKQIPAGRNKVINDESMDGLQDKTCKIIRSILLTSKGGTTAEKLYNDYRDTVGEGIPYRKHGYDNLHSFLKSIPDYCRISRNLSMKGELVVHGVADENTRHMQDLVNRSKTKRRLPPVKGPTRRPMQHSAQWKPPQSQYSHNNQQHQQQQYRGGPGGGGGGGINGRFQPIQRPFGRGGGVPRAGIGRGIMRVGGGMGGGGGGPGGGLNVGRGRGNNYNNNRVYNEAPRSPLRKPRDNYRGPHGGGQRQGGGPGGGGGSGPGYAKHNKNTKPPNKSNTKSPGKARTNYKRDLENYYVQKNLGEVQYKVAAVGKGKEKYMATVTVEGTQFKTYPETYNSKAEAEEAVAAKVVEKLGILSSGDETGDGVSGGSGQETSDPLVYSARVADILGSRHNGVWSTQVEKDYTEKFGERLPSLWFQEADPAKIRVECPVIGSSRYIVFPVSQASIPSDNRPSATSKPNQQQPTPLAAAPKITQVQPPPLEFPSEDMWDVYVSYLRSAMEVNMRLIGPEYSEKLDELSSSMDLAYFDKSNIPVVKNPEIGKLYAAHVSSDWQRVKVVEIRGIQCTCTFLDHGDHDTIPIEDLREIEPQFLELPAQAFTISLSGLEDYEYNENVITRLNELLIGKSFVAKVDNKGELSQNYSPSIFPRLILFDTSSEVDININQKLIEHLVSEDYQNRLPQPGGEEVQVTILSIMNSGEIFCRKEGNTLATIQKQIADNADKILSSGSSGLIGKNQMYLAEQGGILYRGEILSSDKCLDGRYSCFLVDTGIFAQLESNQIYDIPSNCDSLLDIPKLALKCRLEGVPPEGYSWSPEATAALREQAPENTLVRLKVVGGGVDCPTVEIHQLNSNQGSINFDLSTEFDLFPALPTGLSSPDNSINGSPAKVRNGVADGSGEPGSGIPSAVLPPDGEQFDVKVTCAVSPSNFIVQPYNESEKLALLMEDMDNFYNKDENLQEMTPDCMEEGAYLAGRHSDGYWYRIRITKMIDHASAAVRLVDYGDLSMLNLCDMQPLWAKFRQLPLQAINAKLANIQPANGDWRPEDTVWFSNRVADQEFVSVIRKRSPDLGDDFDMIVELSLIDTSHPTLDKFIDQELIEEKRAVCLLASDKASN